jgi:hypothetical protein
MAFLVDKQFFTAFVEETLETGFVDGEEVGVNLKAYIPNPDDAVCEVDKIRFVCTEVWYRLAGDQGRALKRDTKGNFLIIASKLPLYNEYSFNNTLYNRKCGKVSESF